MGWAYFNLLFQPILLRTRLVDFLRPGRLERGILE